VQLLYAGHDPAPGLKPADRAVSVMSCYVWRIWTSLRYRIQSAELTVSRLFASRSLLIPPPMSRTALRNAGRIAIS
jgi:hypothetical protein